jgi:hypothetical protein
MKREPVSSSTMASVGYADGTLEIEFENGHVYRYYDVPVQTHAELLRAASKGQFFNARIRAVYRFERVA